MRKNFCDDCGIELMKQVDVIVGHKIITVNGKRLNLYITNRTMSACVGTPIDPDLCIECLIVCLKEEVNR